MPNEMEVLAPERTTAERPMSKAGRTLVSFREQIELNRPATAEDAASAHSSGAVCPRGRYGRSAEPEDPRRDPTQHLLCGDEGRNGRPVA
jgi:hypothetical protein